MDMFMEYLKVFITGGIICSIGQILIDKTSLAPARILVLYVIFGVFLGAVGLYNPLFEISGCGVSLPLIGYGGNIAKGVKEAVLSNGIFGVFSGAFTAAATGCTVSLFLGFLLSLFFKGKSKNL